MDIDDVSCHTTVMTTVTKSCQESWERSVTRCICEFKHDDGYMICCGLGRKSVAESNKATPVPTKILASPPGVRGRRQHSTSFHSPSKKDVRTSPDLGLPSSSPAKVEQTQRSDHHVRSERMGRGRWNRTRSMNQSSSQEPQPPSSDCGGVTENNDGNRKLTREEKKLEAFMKAFEQIQKEGPKRLRESHPEKRSRKISANSESIESKEVMSESASKVVASQSPASNAVMSELMDSKGVKSTVSRAVMSESQAIKSELIESKAETSVFAAELKAEMLESKTIEVEDKGPDEKPCLAVKKEPLSGSVVDDKDAEKPSENDEDRENCRMLLNLMDENKTTGLMHPNDREKTEMKWKDEADNGGDWTNQVEDNGVIGKPPLTVENVKDEAGEKKMEFDGVQDEHGDVSNLKRDCEIGVKKEQEEVPPVEDMKSELERGPVEFVERPSAVAPASPQKTGKHFEVVIKSEQLSSQEPGNHVSMETNYSPARSDVRGKTPNLERAEEEEEPKDDLTLHLRRSNWRQPSGASELEFSLSTMNSETVVKEPSLETIPGTPSAEENIEAPKAVDAVVKPVVWSKGRPWKVVKDVQKVAGKDPEEKKLVEVRFEHRVRTRSCMKETNCGGVATSKAKPRRRKVSIPNPEIQFYFYHQRANYLKVASSMQWSLFLFAIVLFCLLKTVRGGSEVAMPVRDVAESCVLKFGWVEVVITVFVIAFIFISDHLIAIIGIKYVIVHNKSSHYKFFATSFLLHLPAVVFFVLRLVDDSLKDSSLTLTALLMSKFTCPRFVDLVGFLLLPTSVLVRLVMFVFHRQLDRSFLELLKAAGEMILMLVFRRNLLLLLLYAVGVGHILNMPAYLFRAALCLSFTGIKKRIFKICLASSLWIGALDMLTYGLFAYVCISGDILSPLETFSAVCGFSLVISQSVVSIAVGHAEMFDCS